MNSLVEAYAELECVVQGCSNSRPKFSGFTVNWIPKTDHSVSYYDGRFICAHCLAEVALANYLGPGAVERLILERAVKRELEQ